MPAREPAILALEDGSVFRGRSFGARGECEGEVVFNTSMMGYPEILTDPSYRGQMVCMTYPLIGNYGITPEDFESRKVFLGGFIVKECSRIAANWRSRQTLPEFLEAQGIPAIEGIDTRRLVKRIRIAGALKGVLSTTETDEARLIERAKASPGLVGRDCVREVTCDAPYDWSECLPGSDPARAEFRVVAFDYGIKYNILRCLVHAGCRVTVLPASATAEQALALNPDGIFLSNGPGDPAALPGIVGEAAKLLGRKPIFGICLGHQILGQVYGGTTYKLKFGHHGGNQPVMRLDTRQVEITSQNHGFAVDPESLRGKPVRITHVNLNDRTNEGIAHAELPAFSVQYHPEAAPGPRDAHYLFGQFLEAMRKGR